MSPLLQVAFGVAAVLGVALIVLAVRRRHAAEERARLAQEQRGQRLAADRARDLRERLLALGRLDQANERYWEALRTGEDTAAERAAIAEVLSGGTEALPLTAGLFLTEDLTEGEQQGFLAQYGETTLAGGVRFELAREIDRLSAALWRDVTHSPRPPHKA